MLSDNRLILLCLSILTSLRAFNFVIYLFIYLSIGFFLRISFLSRNAILQKTIMLTYLKRSGGQREPVRIKPFGSALAQLCRHFLKKPEILTRRPTAACFPFLFHWLGGYGACYLNVGLN